MENSRKGLVGKIKAVMAAVSHVEKGGTNTAHNYKYVTEADLVAAVRKAMIEQGLILVPNVIKTEWRELQGKNGPIGIGVCLQTVLFTITDGDSEISFHVLGSGMDSGDKAAYKALTGAEKYALLKLLLIPTGDDPEKDDGKDSDKAGWRAWPNCPKCGSPDNIVAATKNPAKGAYGCTACKHQFDPTEE